MVVSSSRGRKVSSNRTILSQKYRHDTATRQIHTQPERNLQKETFQGSPDYQVTTEAEIRIVKEERRDLSAGPRGQESAFVQGQLVTLPRLQIVAFSVQSERLPAAQAGEFKMP